MSTEATPVSSTVSATPTVTFVEDAKVCQTTSGTNIRKVAKANGVAIQTGTSAWANCHGFGLCGTCRVSVDAAASLTAPTFFERFTLGKDCGKMRLSCQAKIIGDVNVKVKPARDYAEVYKVVLGQSALIGGFSLILLVFMVAMLVDILGAR